VLAEAVSTSLTGSAVLLALALAVAVLVMRRSSTTAAPVPLAKPATTGSDPRVAGLARESRA
jgi:hypothetical protein